MADKSAPIHVPLLDLKAQYASIRAEVTAAMHEVIESQWFIMGPEVKKLEEEIAAYCRTSFAVGCASGSDALLLALMALGVGPDDEVEIVTGSLAEHRFAALYGRADRLVGVLGFNRPRHVMQYKTMIENGASFAEAVAAEV